MTSILDKIAIHKQQEVNKAKQQQPLTSFADRNALPVRDFIAPLRTNNPAIITEIKK